MTIWDIALYTGLAALLWTAISYFIKKPKNLPITFLKNWVGTFFIFSGMVKLVDPSGFSIKIAEYFDVFGTSFLKPFALQFSIVTLVLELVLGIALLFNAQLKWVLKALVALILFFTLLTGVSAIKNVVQDCGCFGDFLKISPWTSFYKDIILTVVIGIIYFNRNKLEPMFKAKGSFAVVGLASIAGLAFTLHNFFHLPIWDFRPYKVGNNIPELMETIKEPVYERKLTYKNTNTGEEQVFINETPDGDEWEFVNNETIVIDEGIDAPIHDFILSDSEGNDLTQAILEFEKPILLFVYPDVKKAKAKGVNKIKALVESSDTDGKFNYAFITSSSDAQMEAYKTKHGLEGTNLSADNTMLKTMIRANPGVVVLKQGNILGKYNVRDIPKPDLIPLN